MRAFIWHDLHSSSDFDSALAASSVGFYAIWRFQNEVRTVVNACMFVIFPR